MSLSTRFRRLFPKRVPVEPGLRVRKREAIDCGSRWTVEFSASDGGRMDGILLVPGVAGRQRCPGLIASHQHNGQWELGKSEPAGLAGDPEMAYGLELCARGYVVLCPDHLGFEGRQQKSGKSRYSLEGRAFEQFVFADAILRGGSLAATYLFDLQQGVDVLEGLEFVDADRLGVIGHSLGGQTSLWLSAMDRRMRVGFASCGFSLVKTIQQKNIPHNCAMYLPGLLEVGDLDDVVASIAPRAFGMCHGLHDRSFPIAGLKQIHARADAVFNQRDLTRCIFRGGHEFPPDIRERAYQFIDSHLRDQ